MKENRREYSKAKKVRVSYRKKSNAESNKNVDGCYIVQTTPNRHRKVRNSLRRGSVILNALPPLTFPDSPTPSPKKPRRRYSMK